MREASMREIPSGLLPSGEGWFVVNVADAAWDDHDRFGASCGFESSEQRFAELGINVRVLMPGQSNGRYHREAIQEDFLVLAGECTLLVEEEERQLKAWDFVHCPPGTTHIFVGAGDGPCVLLGTSPRVPGHEIVYPVSELALRRRAGVERETNSPPEAYADVEPDRLERPACWDALPWSSGTGPGA
jgi:uncharacterized cupin superfamily protein